MIGRTLARLAPVVSLAICLARGDLTSAAVMLLVCLGTTICWRARPNAAFEVGFNLTLLVAAWSATWRLYERWPGWDLVVHFVVIAFLAGLAAASVRRWCINVAPTPWLTLAAGTLMSLIWECLELAGHHLVDPSIDIGVADTIGDLVAGILGATLTACCVRQRSLPAPRSRAKQR